MEFWIYSSIDVTRGHEAGDVAFSFFRGLAFARPGREFARARGGHARGPVRLVQPGPPRGRRRAAPVLFFCPFRLPMVSLDQAAFPDTIILIDSRVELLRRL